jgi:signal peptidase II
MKPSRLYLRLFLVAGIIVGLDQLSKTWALASFRTPHEVIPGWLTFRILYNPGGAFGILQGFPEVFLVASLVAAIVILFWVRRIEQPGWTLPLGLVLGGGIGNLVDRVFRDTDGRVVDFIDVHVWPVFNVADASIVIGVVMILVLGLRDGRVEEHAEAEAAAEP